MQRRKPDAEGRVGPIKANRVSSVKSIALGNDELAAQLARRSQLLEKV